LYTYSAYEFLIRRHDGKADGNMYLTDVIMTYANMTSTAVSHVSGKMNEVRGPLVVESGGAGKGGKIDVCGQWQQW